MFKTIILICSFTTPASDCNKSTAKSVIVGPMVSMMACATGSQTMMANEMRNPDDNTRVEMGKTYQKTLCVDTSTIRTVK